MQHLYLFGLVGLFILLMSTINFINLNSAQSLKRLREIGVKKVLGSSRVQLVRYFLIESLLITFLAGILALLVANYLLPVLQKLVPVSPDWLKILPAGCMILLIISFLAGAYPAFILSRREILPAIRGTQKSGRSSGANTKNLLVSVQLTLCVVLISSALITRLQFQFLTDKNLGLEKEQVLAITNLPFPVKMQYQQLKEELQQYHFVQGVAASMEVPSREIRDTGPVYAEGMLEDPENAPVMDIQVVDNDFLDLMQLDLLAGYNFRESTQKSNAELTREDLLKHIQDQPREYILNETALKRVGWKNPEDAIGRQFSWRIGKIQLQQGPVIGVVKDFHQESLRNHIEPLVIINEPAWIGNMLVKVNTSDLQEAVSTIRQVWQKNFPDYALEYTFLDDLFNQLYEQERKQLQLIYLFSGLAVVIAFLGIFGLLSYTLKTREKELAIRKILGATFLSITLLLGRMFTHFTLAGIFIAIPFTWISLEKWLQHFAYRIDIHAFNFLAAVFLILGVLGLTIALQLKKFADAKLTSMLRNE
jgi:putative ABC transport system permease protein